MNIRDPPKTGFTFSVVTSRNENAAENEISFSAWNRNKNENCSARHFWLKTKLVCWSNNIRQISSVLLCEYATDAAQI